MSHPKKASPGDSYVRPGWRHVFTSRISFAKDDVFAFEHNRTVHGWAPFSRSGKGVIHHGKPP